MGHTISARTGRRLDELERDGRDCRAGGFCRSRATIRIYYNRPGGQPLRACLRHARQVLAAPVVRDHIGELILDRVEEY